MADHYDIRFDEASPWSHFWGEDSLCDCSSCGQKLTTLCRFDTSDPILTTYRQIMPMIPVLYCANCCSADDDFQIQYNGGFKVVQFRTETRTDIGVLPLRQRRIALGPEISLDTRRKPMFSGFGAVSSNNYFLDVKGILNRCVFCKVPLTPVFLFPNFGNVGTTPDLMYICDIFYSVTKGNSGFMYPDAEYLTIGICPHCRVVGQESGPY